MLTGSVGLAGGGEELPRQHAPTDTELACVCRPQYVDMIIDTDKRQHRPMWHMGFEKLCRRQGLVCMSAGIACSLHPSTAQRHGGHVRYLGMQARHLLRSSGLPLQKRCRQRLAPNVLGMSSYRSIPAPGSKSEAQLESTCTETAWYELKRLHHDMSSPAGMSGVSAWSSRQAGRQAICGSARSNTISLSVLGRSGSICMYRAMASRTWTEPNGGLALQAAVQSAQQCLVGRVCRRADLGARPVQQHLQQHTNIM